MIITTESILAASLLFIAVALVAGNNLSACVGTLVGSGTIRTRTGIMIGVVGYIAGLLLQGGNMASVPRLLLASPAADMAAAVFSVTIVIFVIGMLFRIPISLSMSLVGVMAGISVAHGTPAVGYLDRVIALWIAAPLLSILAGAISTRAIAASRPRDVWKRAAGYKVLLLASSFAASYVLGANTIGVIVAISGFTTANLLIAGAAVAAGSILLSRRTLRRIGRDIFLLRYSNASASLLDSIILVESATLLGLPLSNTQAVTSALFGAGLTHREKFLSAKPFMVIVAGWVAAPLISFGFGLLM